MALAAAHGRAARTWKVRVCLASDFVDAHPEIAFLQDELRLKDLHTQRVLPRVRVTSLFLVPPPKTPDHRIMATIRTRHTYDHRLQQLVRETGDIRIALEHGVPRSTARDWSRSSRADIVTLDLVERSTLELEREVALLRKRIAKLIAVLRLLVVLTRVLGITLANRRVPDGSGKQRFLQAVERSRTSLPLRIVLRILGISSSRYHSWTRDEACTLEDASSCPRSHPHQITTEELQVVKDMATSEDYRHVPTGTLAVLAQRLGKVFASSATWYRLVRRHRLRRPRKRIHPPKPKVGIRASAPNEIWHIDTTVLKLLDGTRAYLHAVLDNFSRKVLAWRVSQRFDPGNTLAILLEAARNMAPAYPPLPYSPTPASRTSTRRSMTSSARASFGAFLR